MAKSKQLLSLFDLMKGVAEVDKKLIEKYPEAAKVPHAKRRMIEGMSPQEVIDFYNKEGLLGKFRSGEPAVADIVRYIDRPGSRVSGIEEITGELPRRDAYVRVFGEGQLNKPVNERLHRGIIEIDQDDTMERSIHMYPGVKALLEEARRNPTKTQRIYNREPITQHLTTTSAPPDVGSQTYQMLFDMARAEGNVNVADVLTPLNQVRRPLNVMNSGLAHGDYRNVVPLGDRGLGRADEQMGQRLEDAFADDTEVAQFLYLKNLFGSEDLANEILTLDPGRLAVMGISNAPEGATGYLSLLNALRSATAGPARYQMLREYIHPGDLPALKGAVDLDAMVNKAGPRGAFGPGALGRARTAEAAVQGLRQQMTPDEIVEEITKGVDPTWFYGRYAKGGLAAALM